MRLIPCAPGVVAPYLSIADAVEVDDPAVRALRGRILRGCGSDPVEAARRLYEAVRDRFPHSFDIEGEGVAVGAADVLRLGHGICFAKSHLLAALLRGAGVPTGFCYQKLVLDDEKYPYHTLHGLVAVFLDGRWTRLDARGNKSGVDAQFDLERERLAFPVRPACGEEDIPLVFDKPDANVLAALRTSATVHALREHLPVALSHS